MVFWDDGRVRWKGLAGSRAFSCLLVERNKERNRCGLRLGEYSHLLNEPHPDPIHLFRLL